MTSQMSLIGSLRATKPIKNQFLRMLLLVLLGGVYHGSACCSVNAQELPPPPPPARDYFPEKWDEYTSRDGAFRIRFPSKPQEALTQKEELDIHSLEYKGLIKYRISYVDYKVPIENPQNVKDMLQQLKANALNSIGDKDARVVAEREVIVDGHAGIFIHLEVQPREVIRIQWVPVGSRLYTISASSRKGSPRELEGQDDFEKVAMGFISSFQITQ